MINRRQTHFDAIALAVDAFGSVSGNDETTRYARRGLMKAALETIGNFTG